MSGGYLSIQAWLQSKGTVLWGGYWDVTDKHERPLAAAWFQQQLAEYEEWTKEREYDERIHERIVTAGTALNNLAAGRFEFNPAAVDRIVGAHLNLLGRSDPSTLQPAPPNGIIDPGDPQGHQHPEGSQGSGDSEHSGGIAGSAEGNRSVPAHVLYGCNDPVNCPWHGTNRQRS